MTPSLPPDKQQLTAVHVGRVGRKRVEHGKVEGIPEKKNNKKIKNSSNKIKNK